MNLLFGIWLLSATAQIVYLVYFHLHSATYKSKYEEQRVHKPVSVIICARNEAENLKKHIPYLLEQNYPLFEIVVVDDGSTDDSLNILDSLMTENNLLKVYHISNTSPGKKEALSYAIEKANYEWLLLTDADCTPYSLDWIELMVQAFDENKDIVLGLGPLNYKRGFLNALQRFENEVVALLFTGFALRGKAYMGVGRNLAYKKSVFLSEGGFESHGDITSGDDDLFISAVADKKNVSVQNALEARSYSDAPHSWKKWLKQKSRHQSTAKFYKTDIKILLNIWYFSYMIFFLFSGILLLLNCNIIIVLLVYLIRQCLQFYSLKNLNTGHRIKTNTFALFLFDWALLVFYFLSTILLIFRKPDEW